MVAFPIRQRMILPLAPVAAMAVAVLVVAVVMLIPAHLLEALVEASAIPALLPAAEPPLGMTARFALAITVGAGSAAGVWSTITLIIEPSPRPVRVKRTARHVAADGTPVLRKADAHPDAPPRPPLLATRDLGAPFLEVRAPRVPVERPLPLDLDVPLAAFDPAAIPAEPVAPNPAVQPLARPRPVLGAGERLETFVLAPPIVTARTDATIHALLDRLEAGVGQRARRATVRKDTRGDFRLIASGGRA